MGFFVQCLSPSFLFCAEEAELLDGVESGVKQLLHKTAGLHSEAKEQTVT